MPLTMEQEGMDASAQHLLADEYSGPLPAASRSERKTENLVRKRLEKLGYYKAPDIVVEEQRSDSPRIRKLLQTASKKGGGAGYPEFIITARNAPDFMIVVECKADPTKHISQELAKPAEYAVDGALHYA